MLAAVRRSRSCDSVAHRSSASVAARSCPAAAAAHQLAPLSSPRAASDAAAHRGSPSRRSAATPGCWGAASGAGDGNKQPLGANTAAGLVGAGWLDAASRTSSPSSSSTLENDPSRPTRILPCSAAASAAAAPPGDGAKPGRAAATGRGGGAGRAARGAARGRGGGAGRAGTMSSASSSSSTLHHDSWSSESPPPSAAPAAPAVSAWLSSLACAATKRSSESGGGATRLSGSGRTSGAGPRWPGCAENAATEKQDRAGPLLTSGPSVKPYKCGPWLLHHVHFFHASVSY